MNTSLKALAFYALCPFLFFTACQSSSEEESFEASWEDLPVSSESEEAVAEFTKGLEMVDAGFSPDAYKHFEAALEKDPNLVSAHVYAAWFAPSSTGFGKHLKAMNAKKESANEAEQQLIRMTNGLANGDYGEQHQAGLKLVELYPESARAHAYLGFVLEGVDKDAEAREEYKKAVELAPDWVGGHSYLVNSYMFEDPIDMSAAQSHANKMVELKPEMASCHILLGDTYRAQQNLGDALAAYQKAAQLEPDNEVAYSKAGHAHTYMGNFDAARASFKKAMEVAENPTPSINFTAFTYLYDGDYDGAKNYINDAAGKLSELGVSSDAMAGARMALLNIRSTMAMHHGDAGLLNELNAQRDEAGKALAATVETESAEAFMAADKAYWEGIALVMAGDYEGTLAKAEENKQALESINDPTKLRAYNFLLGYLGMHEEDYDNAIAHFEQTDQDNMYNRYMLAMANEKAGNMDKAMALYEEIANYNFNNVGYALVRNEVKNKVDTAP